MKNELQIFLYVPGSNFYTNRSSTRPFTQVFHQIFQIFPVVDSRESRWTLNILSRLFPSDFSNFRSYLFSRKMSAHSRLCTLTYFYLNSIRIPEILISNTVFIRHILKNVFISSRHLLRQNAALSGTHCSTSHGTSF